MKNNRNKKEGKSKGREEYEKNITWGLVLEIRLILIVPCTLGLGPKDAHLFECTSPHKSAPRLAPRHTLFCAFNNYGFDQVSWFGPMCAVNQARRQFLFLLACLTHMLYFILFLMMICLFQADRVNSTNIFGHKLAVYQRGFLLAASLGTECIPLILI